MRRNGSVTKQVRVVVAEPGKPAHEMMVDVTAGNSFFITNLIGHRASPIAWDAPSNVDDVVQAWAHSDPTDPRGGAPNRGVPGWDGQPGGILVVRGTIVVIRHVNGEWSGIDSLSIADAKKWMALLDKWRVATPNASAQRTYRIVVADVKKPAVIVNLATSATSRAADDDIDAYVLKDRVSGKFTDIKILGYDPGHGWSWARSANSGPDNRKVFGEIGHGRIVVSGYEDPHSNRGGAPRSLTLAEAQRWVDVLNAAAYLPNRSRR